MPSYLTLIVRLAFLAPAITGAILAEQQPRNIIVKTLTPVSGSRVGWREQQAVLMWNEHSAALALVLVMSYTLS
ncbi:hypothetical protein [Sphingomonas citricola]|uniref:hypothetical protein n=1 Tax=Sphingomonas citricola TaxID=2862498 RepID=UPI001CA4E972|nr:hypothetical protein [Sphingomonas citricola]